MKKIILVLLASLFIACNEAKEDDQQKKNTFKIVIRKNYSKEFFYKLIRKLNVKNKAKIKTENKSFYNYFSNKNIEMVFSTSPISKDERNKLKEKGIEVREFAFAYDALSVIINKDNPLTSITTDNLKLIFEGDIDDWKELGWETNKIKRVTGRPNSKEGQIFENSLDVDFDNISKLNREREKDEENKKEKLELIRVSDEDSIIEEVKKDKTAIGYVGRHEVKGVKSIMINGVLPVKANFDSGFYPIGKTKYIVYRKDSSLAKSLVKRFKNDSSLRKFIENNDYYPVQD